MNGDDSGWRQTKHEIVKFRASIDLIARLANVENVVELTTGDLMRRAAVALCDHVERTGGIGIPLRMISESDYAAMRDELIKLRADVIGLKFVNPEG